MRHLTERELLDVWEQGLNQPLLQRALLLLVFAFPELSPDAIAELSIGARDARLLYLREHLFGSQCINTAICPRCSERIEWTSEVSDLRIQSLTNESFSREFKLNLDDIHLSFRMPNSNDVAAVINEPEADMAQRKLLARCITSIEIADESCDVGHLPDHIIVALNERMEELDPQAAIHMHVRCPGCAHTWNVLFDIANFLWVEVNDWAERMLQSIHRLARGYGWTEDEILKLSPVRRQLYLGMLGA